MKTNTFLLFVCVLLLMGCRSLPMQVLEPTALSLQHPLPPMQPEIEDPQAVPPPPVLTENPEDWWLTDHRYPLGTPTLLQTAFRREVEERLCRRGGPSAGRVILRVDYMQRRPGLGWLYLSGATLGLAPLLGVPLAKPATLMGIEVLLVRPGNEIAGRYRAVGRGQAAAALWYGYSRPDAVLKADLEAFKNAFDDVKKQIDADAARLQVRLRPGLVYAPADTAAATR